MEIKFNRKTKGTKAQMFSLTSLIFILLMVATLLIFVTLGIGYDNLSTATIQSSSAINYGQILSKSASTFARSSAIQALHTLFVYEYYPSKRSNNFIANFSQYMQSLMETGTLPNTNFQINPNGYLFLSHLMSGQTLQSYNLAVNSITGVGSKQIAISETTPLIFQPNPYSIGVAYTENVIINTSTGTYSFTVPVNVSVPLNNTPDLFYAQQGIYKTLSFSNINKLAIIIGNLYATSGNTMGFTYGTIYWLPAGTTCASLPAYVPTTQPYESQGILATPDAAVITGQACIKSYGGLITEHISSAPPIPYLIYSPSANVLSYLQTGEQVLLYGPSLAVMNITNMINNISSEQYFTSPFAASYSDRASGFIQRQSPNGIFTFAGFDRQAGIFNGQLPSFIQTATIPTSPTTLTVTAWVYPTNIMGNDGIVGQGDIAPTAAKWELKVNTPICSMSNYYDFVIFGTHDNCFGPLQINKWQFITAEYNYLTGNVFVFINGTAVTCNDITYAPGAACYEGPGQPQLQTSQTLYIGTDPSDAAPLSFNGMIANIQTYNSILSDSQVSHLYQEGIENIPISNASLVAWWPLNGNPNDYGGQGVTYGWTSVPSSLSYGLLINYTGDSIFPSAVSANTYPLPGILNCNNNAQCASNSLQHVYISDFPLEIGNTGLTAAYFDAQTSNIVTTTINTPTNTMVVSAWVYPTNTVVGNAGIVGQGFFGSLNWQLKINGYEALTCTASSNDYFDFVIYGIQDNCFGPVALNTWQQVTVVYNSNNNGIGNVIGFINGAQQPCYIPSLPSGASCPVYPEQSLGTNNGLYIGYTPGDAGLINFNGLITNIQISNTLVTQQQALQLYREGINGQPITPANVIAWWPLAVNAKDYSGNGYNGGSNSIAYEFIQQNYTVLASTSQPTGLQTVSGVSNEWQALGFPTHP